MAFGMEALASEPDLLVLGEMGIGNTTTAAAIYHALHGGEAEEWVGRGTGVDDEGLRRKADAVRAAAAGVISPILTIRSKSWRASGGARPQRSQARSSLHACAERPCCSTASSCARPRRCCSPSTNPALDHCLAAHLSAERAHRHALKLIGKAPLLDLGMRLGEGSGGALAVGVVKAAVACHNGMATFAEAGVAGKEEP